MKKDNIVNKNNSNKSIKVGIICSALPFICGVLSFIIGGVIANFTHTKISIPLGLIMIYATFIIISICLLISIIKIFNKSLKESSKKIWEILRRFFLIIVAIFILVRAVNYVYLGCKDIIKGPKEIPLTSVTIVREHVLSRTLWPKI